MLYQDNNSAKHINLMPLCPNIILDNSPENIVIKVKIKSVKPTQ